MTLVEIYEARVAEGRLDPDPAQRAVLPELERIRAELAAPVRKGFFRKAPEPVRGLYLWGGVGSGKSMLMDLLADQVTAPSERRHFHAFMQWVHHEMGEARKRGVDDAIKPVADDLGSRIRFLAFDEMQITDIADAMIVGRLFERLFGHGVTVVTTSNRHPDELYKEGLNRYLFQPFIDMIKDRCVVHELKTGTDHRQGKYHGERTYFTPNDAAARAALRDIWERLTGGASDPLILKVQGREVEIPAFHNGVARANFFDLCARPLGPADYLALAAAVKVLILEEVPQLSSANFNEAKRFVTLIDTLYEARVKLFVSAAARPEMLYMEGAGSFEFERTASRLEEMQTEDWAS